MHIYEMTILEKHLDSFGHVNNATYLEILEEARWDLITKNGYGYKEIHEKKIGPVVLDVQLAFRKELILREKIRIQTATMSWKSRIGKLEQKILKANDEVAAEAVFTFGLFDLRERKLIPPTPEWFRAIEWSGPT